MKPLTLVLVPAIALISSAAQADLLLDLRLDDTTRSRSVAAGSTTFVDLFIVDTDGTSALATEGLVAAGARLLESNTAGSSATASFASPGTGFVNSVLPPASTPPGISSMRVSAPFPTVVNAVAATAGVTANAVAGAVEILLGRFAVVATGPAGNVHTLTAGINGGMDNGFTTGLGTDLDSIITSAAAPESVTLTVSSAAVPEASTLVFATLLVGAVVVYRRKKQLAISA